MAAQQGPGKYDDALTLALEQCNGLEGILIVTNGPKGPGFSAQLTLEGSTRIPSILRQLADKIEGSNKPHVN